MHEPHIGWFLGVSKAQGEKNRAEILQLLERVRNNPAQIVPGLERPG